MPRLLSFLALFLCGVLPLHAQDAPGRGGVAYVTGWPGDALHAAHRAEYELLPSIDTLALAYRYHAGAETPALALGVSWKPGATAVLDGEVVPFDAAPAGVRLVAIELEADVLVGGARAGTFFVAVDSLVLAPRPDSAAVDLLNLSWETVFADMGSEAARAAFAEGFVLRDLRIVNAAFADLDEGPVAETGREGRRRGPAVGRRPPRRVTVFHPGPAFDVLIRLDWLLNRPRWRPDGEEVPRADAMGRGAADSRAPRRPRVRTERDGARGGGAADTADSGPRRGEERAGEDAEDRAEDDSERSGRRGGLASILGGDDDDGDDEDEDDENKLVPAAIAAAAAVGVLAYAGGTVGYYGDLVHAPVGIQAGLVRSWGGVLLQASVNRALIAKEDGPRRFSTRVLGIGRLLDGPFQPALGLGVLATQEGEVVDVAPTLTVGAAASVETFVFHAGYDVLQGGLDVGLAFNFRAMRGGR